MGVFTWINFNQYLNFRVRWWPGWKFAFHLRYHLHVFLYCILEQTEQCETCYLLRLSRIYLGTLASWRLVGIWEKGGSWLGRHGWEWDSVFFSVWFWQKNQDDRMQGYLPEVDLSSRGIINRYPSTSWFVKRFYYHLCLWNKK